MQEIGGLPGLRLSIAHIDLATECIAHAMPAILARARSLLLLWAQR